ncbi:hypothetical protein CEUSTIGMA_g11630.t1 [Chlamydomonas eustigma]|uniref:Guanylate cyclase domain-containing protein n=1 Tax=Chlamydomonas eustigma TaxID=1157962 RepID=A0A250XMA9_9CHLO|nr:hypothetical protein CEUSTIGMA_g11630.t1 [Chlamydomonas eustigma]|eukprot:GAX84207.1 hypothetical protein CEUSTIGMA_g11630.t1 [Chlamydomonas eustigma]
MYCSEDATFSNAGRNISPSENFIAIIAAMYLGSAEYQQVLLDLASAREVLNDVFPASIASQVVLRSIGSTASLYLPPISCPSSPRGPGENLRPASNSRRFAKGIRRPSYSFLFDSSQGITTNLSLEEEKTDMTKESLLMSSSGLEMEVDLNDMQTTAQLHPSVTVLFADIVGFTAMGGQLTPQVVMQFLNSLFSKFDQLSKEMMVYKVETIGDCYMCATGLQHDDPDHARTMVRFALAMQDAANQVLMPTTGMPVKIRVGIHSGSVLSGIVGTLRMRWCLFGDTVNTASRMESTGSPGRIQISSSTYEMICARAEMDQELCLESRGILSIKGKGDMETYFVEKRNEGEGGHEDLIVQKRNTELENC